MRSVRDLLARPPTTDKARAWANRFFDLDGDLRPLLGRSHDAWGGPRIFSALDALVVCPSPGRRTESKLGHTRHRRDDSRLHRCEPAGNADFSFFETLP